VTIEVTSAIYETAALPLELTRLIYAGVVAEISRPTPGLDVTLTATVAVSGLFGPPVTVAVTVADPADTAVTKHELPSADGVRVATEALSIVQTGAESNGTVAPFELTSTTVAVKLWMSNIVTEIVDGILPSPILKISPASA
jgi:hypothetical protein